MRNKILILQLFFALIYFQCKAQFLVSDTSEFKKILDSVVLNQKGYTYIDNYKKIPKFIRKGLDKVNKNKFKIANPNENLNASWPNRQLIYACISDKYIIITYIKNNDRATMNRSMIIRYRNNKKIYWIINFVPPDHKNVDELIEFIKYKKELLSPESNI